MTTQLEMSMDLKRFRTTVALPEVRDMDGALIRPPRNEDIEIVINIDALAQRMGPSAIKNRSGISVVAGGAVLVKQIL